MRYFQSPNGRIVVFLETEDDFKMAGRMLSRALNTLEPTPPDYLKLSNAVQQSIDRTKAPCQR